MRQQFGSLIQPATLMLAWLACRCVKPCLACNSCPLYRGGVVALRNNLLSKTPPSSHPF